MPAPRLAPSRARRLERLLNMLYKPGEIAAELGITDETLLRSYVPAGAPVTLDSQGRMWFNGKAFAAWARQYVMAKKVKQPMSETEGYCFRCHKVMTMERIHKKPSRPGVVMLTGICTACRGKINRLAREA